MKAFNEAYELCRKKFDVHMEKFDKIQDGASCVSGDYYKDGQFGDFFNMWSWTASFITGLAPLLYNGIKDEKYLKWANKFKDDYRKKIFDLPLETMHDIGFLYSPYSVAMYKITGDNGHKKAAIKAADELLKRFEIKGGYIDAWGRMDDDTREGRAIIDCMMNIQLLLWAWKETNHTMYRDVARAHADTVIKVFVRDDYSVAHSFVFDRETGEVVKESNTCGFADGSHWARGTAWMVFGLARAARYLNNKEYYELAVKICEKYINCCDETGVPIWDFRLPNDMPAKRCGNMEASEKVWDETNPENCKFNVDTSATAIMACAIFELNDFEANERLKSFAINSMNTLCEKYLNKDEKMPGILSHQNGQMRYTTFGDYFFVEALSRALFKNEVCW